MQITDVRIRKITSEGKMKAIVSVTFNNEFVVHDIKIIEELRRSGTIFEDPCPEMDSRIDWFKKLFS